MATPDFISVLQADLDAGLFSAKISRAISDAALAVVEHGEKGRKAKVTIELTLARIGESHQIDLTHKISSSRPTRRGKVAEEDSTSTPMYVGPHGALSIAPAAQMRLFEGD